MFIHKLKQFLSVIFIAFLFLYQPLVFAQEADQSTDQQTHPDLSFTPTPIPEQVQAPTDDQTDTSPSESTPTPPSTSTLTPTPTTDPNQSEDYYEHSQIVEDTEDYSFTYPNTTDSADIINSGDDSEITSTDSATVDLTLENINDFTHAKDITTENNTGGNEAEKNIDIYGIIKVETGDAEINEHISTVANTNITGTGILPLILNFFNTEQSDINYAAIRSCYENTPIISSDIDFSENTGNNIRILEFDEDISTIGIVNTNNADVINNIYLKATTGDNSAVENIGSTHVITGNAVVNLDMFNMLNTNLTGTCGFFGVMNFFAPQTSNLILPYELEYLYPGYDTSLAILNSGDGSSISDSLNRASGLTVNNNNNADAVTTISTDGNTGNNAIVDTISFHNPPTITTGDATSRRNILDIANINITADGFMYLRINHFGNWTGQLLGYEPLFTGLDYSIYRITLDEANTILNSGDNADITVEESQTDIAAVENDNNAYLRNNITLEADTGNNEAGRFNTMITTGNAEITADVFNLINTNIFGNNWYFGIINMFEKFEGDIILPRPDMAVHMSAYSSEIRRGETLTYSITYKNEGYLAAKNVSIVALLPSESEYISSSPTGQASQKTISWLLGTVNPGVSGTLNVTVRVLESAGTSVSATSVATTTSYEPYKDNNTASVTIAVVEASQDSGSGGAVVSGASQSSGQGGSQESEESTSSESDVTDVSTISTSISKLDNSSKNTKITPTDGEQNEEIATDSGKVKAAVDEKTAQTDSYFNWNRMFTLQEVLIISFLSFIAGVISTVVLKKVCG